MTGTRQCIHCGGQMSSAASKCPWCSRGRGSGAFLEFLLGGIVAVGIGTLAALGTGVLTSEQVVNAVYSLVDRVPAPPGSDAVSAPALSTGLARDEDEDVAARSERIGRQARTTAGAGCADPGTLEELVQRYRDWADGDLALIACGRIRSGFTSDQVVAAMGEPTARVALGGGTEEWRYQGRRVTVTAGQVVAETAE